MRRVDPSFVAEPDFSGWLARAGEARQAVLDAVAAGEPIRWRRAVWRELKDRFLIECNHRKCMYCEGAYVAGSHNDAEHYRPKKAVTEDRHTIKHPGYYWLAYEWQNVLLSCQKCNGPHSNGAHGRHSGKLNEFPIAGSTRIREPHEDPEKWWTQLESENPLLLHPYFDQPEEHFRAGKHGVVIPITDRGKITRDVCDLNRLPLCEQRELAEERQLGYRPYALMWRLRREEPFDDLLFGGRDPFSVYLNSRLVSYAKALLEG